MIRVQAISFEKLFEFLAENLMPVLRSFFGQRICAPTRVPSRMAQLPQEILRQPPKVLGSAESLGQGKGMAVLKQWPGQDIVRPNGCRGR